MSTATQSTQTTISMDSLKGPDKSAILQLDNIQIVYPIYGGFFQRKVGELMAVRDVSLILKPGETLGLVGESGCGKTTIGKGILGLVPIKKGKLYYDQKEVTNKISHEVRKKIQMVFQDPDASLNPRMKIVDILGEPLRNLMGMTKKSDIRLRALELLQTVSMKQEHLDRYPHEFSGGQKQRIVIARSLACNPQIMILDEPTSALDVSVQSQILNLLADLQKQFHLSFLFITHDLSVIHHIGNRVDVMYLGKIVEEGTVEEIFYNPQHYYTKALLSARPSLNDEERRTQIILEKEIPSLLHPPDGCLFNPRCYTEKLPECDKIVPHVIELSPTHKVLCHKFK
jgi:peptide/nickel transport system ATP-binding protein